MWDQEGRATRSWLLERLPGCEGWLSMLSDRIDAEILDCAIGLRVISQMSVGVDNIDVPACRERGITVGHTPDVLTEATADTAFALMAAAVRQIAEGARIVKSGEWGPWDPWHFLSGDLHGATLGIVGMGRIGQAIARRARGFDMDVIYTSRSHKEIPDTVPVGLAELLARSDIVVIAVALDDETRGMIGIDELRGMKDTAFLVNIARGPIVKTDALVAALAEGSVGVQRWTSPTPSRCRRTILCSSSPTASWCLTSEAQHCPLGGLWPPWQWPTSPPTCVGSRCLHRCRGAPHSRMAATLSPVPPIQVALLDVRSAQVEVPGGQPEP